MQTELTDTLQGAKKRIQKLLKRYHAEPRAEKGIMENLGTLEECQAFLEWQWKTGETDSSAMASKAWLIARPRIRKEAQLEAERELPPGMVMSLTDLETGETVYISEEEFYRKEQMTFADLGVDGFDT